MRTQAAFDLLQSAKEIRVALSADGPRIADLLTADYPPPVVDGQPLFDYGNQVRHLVHGLETAEAGVVAAEDAHMKQEVRVSRLRTERDRKTKGGYGKLIAARQGLDGLQGDKGGFETAFVSGTAPRRAKRLLEQLAQSVTLLNEPAVEPRSPKVAGFDIDYASVAGDLEAARLDLQATVDRLDEESKRAEGTMLNRQEAIKELGSTVVWAGRSAEGLFHRAGKSELARRIRSSTRRPQRPSEAGVAGESPAAGGSQPAGDAPAGGQQAAGEAPPASDSTAGEPASEPVAGSEEQQSSDS